MLVACLGALSDLSLIPGNASCSSCCGFCCCRAGEKQQAKASCASAFPSAAQGSAFTAKQTQCSARSFQSWLRGFPLGAVVPSRAPMCVLRSDLALAGRPCAVRGSADAVPGRPASPPCAEAPGVQAHPPPCWPTLAQPGLSSLFFFCLSSFISFLDRGLP